MRRILLTAVALAALALSASAALAGDGAGMPGWGGSVYLFGQNAPFTTTGAFPTNIGIVGLGYEMTGRLGGGHWGWAGAFGYGMGSIKDEVTSGGPTTTSEISATHYEVRLGMDYWDECCDEYWFCGPGLVYQSTKVTLKQTAAADQVSDPYKVFGIDPRAGGALKLGSGGMRLWGSMSMLLGRASFKDTSTPGTELKQSGWIVQPGWRGGLRFQY